jgi:flagellin-like hook-associated protein FlgL
MTDPISTGGLFDTAARNVSSLRTRLSELGREVSTKKHVDLATNDPAAARTAWALRHEVTQAESGIETAETALRRSKAAEQALGQVKTIAQDAYETALAAPTADGATQFGHAGEKAQKAASQIAGTLNTELAGTHLFAGTETGTSPMAAVADETKAGSPLGMVKDRLETLLQSGGSAPAVTQVQDRHDALAVTAKASATVEAQSGVTLSAGTSELRDADTGEVVGTVHVGEAGDRVTLALAPDQRLPDTGSYSRKVEVELNGTTKAFTLDGGSLNDLADDMKSGLTNHFGSVLNTGATSTATGGLDAEFHGDPGSAGYYGTVYDGATGADGRLTARANGTDVAYSARADSTAVRNVMQGLLLEAVVDKPQRSGSLDSRITREGVNALRDIATSRLKAGIDGLAREQGDLGLAQRSLEDAKETLSARKDAAETRINELENVDRAAAITKLQNVRADLQATYKTTARLQQLSLARYL